MNTLTQDSEAKQAKTSVRIPRDVWAELRREAYEKHDSIEAVLERIARQHYGLSEPQSKTA